MNQWLAALGSGIMIGISASLLLWLNGRIAGISGIVNGLMLRPAACGWRLAFVIGLIGAGALAVRWTGQAASSPASMPILVLAGLLVGFGTSLGAGCTSGHGVCGLGRLSKRSLAAVLVFMATAIITVYVTRHVVGAAA